MLHAAVSSQGSCIFVGVIEAALAFTEVFGNFHRVPCCRFHIGEIGGSGGTACNGNFCYNSHTYNRCIGGGAWLKNAVQVIQVIAVWSNIQSAQSEHCRELAGHTFHDAEQVFTDSQDVTFLHRIGDGKAPLIDDAVNYTFISENVLKISPELF